MLTWSQTDGVIDSKVIQKKDSSWLLRCQIKHVSQMASAHNFIGFINKLLLHLTAREDKNIPVKPSFAVTAHMCAITIWLHTGGIGTVTVIRFVAYHRHSQVYFVFCSPLFETKNASYLLVAARYKTVAKQTVESVTSCFHVSLHALHMQVEIYIWMTAYHEF